MRRDVYNKIVIFSILSIILGSGVAYLIINYQINLITIILSIINIIIYFRILVLISIKKTIKEKILLAQFIFFLLFLYLFFIMCYWNFSNKVEISLAIFSEVSFIVFLILSIVKLKSKNKI